MRSLEPHHRWRWWEGPGFQNGDVPIRRSFAVVWLVLVVVAVPGRRRRSR